LNVVILGTKCLDDEEMVAYLRLPRERKGGLQSYTG
jgi:hypothetical protein